jgi:prepilin-type N-terminal cleavage/methylation domain-containing protein
MNRKMNHSIQSSQRAFTLIELLVVISIIALLLSILMPALQKAKEAARTVVCQAGVKQMSLAANLYSTDNKDNMVVYQRYISATDQYIWANDICPYINNREGAKGYQGGDWVMGSDEKARALSVFLCPAARERNDIIGLNWRIRYGMSYMIGSRQKGIPSGGNQPTYDYYKKGQIRRPDVKILFGDTTDNTNRNVSEKYRAAFARKWADPVGWVMRHYFSLTTERSPGAAFVPPADRHKDSVFVFVDGHVQKMLYKDVQLLDTDTPEERDRKLMMFNGRDSDRVGSPWEVGR